MLFDKQGDKLSFSRKRKRILVTLNFLQKMLGWLVHLCRFLFHIACLLSVISNRWGKEERQYQTGKLKEHTKTVSAQKPAQRDLCAVLVLSPPILLHASSIPLFLLKFSSC